MSNQAFTSRAVTGLKRLGKAWGRRILGAGYRPELTPSHWGLERCEGELTLRGVKLSSIVATHGTPLHVVDEVRLMDNLKAFQTVPSGLSQALDVFYSYKTNPLPWVLETLHRHGAGAEVISEYELWLAIQLNVPAHKIVFNGPAKSHASLETAIKLGIHSIHVNNLEELDLIARLAQQLGRRARVGIRITSLAGWTGQFGFPVEDGSAFQAYERALSLPSLEVVALHSHRGFLIRDEPTLRSYLGFLLDFCLTLHQRLGWSPQVLDVGGSLAVPTTRYLDAKEIRRSVRYLVPPKPPQPEATLGAARYAEIVLRQVQSHFLAQRLPEPQIITEPGRALTANAQMLIASVENIRKSDDFDFAVLDAGVSVASIVTSEYHALLPLREGTHPSRCHRVVGPICHMGDTLFPAQYLSPLQVGDALAILDSGAYFIADASSFSFPQPAVVALTCRAEVVKVRERESFEHLVSLDHFTRGSERR